MKYNYVLLFRVQFDLGYQATSYPDTVDSRYKEH